ncbi:MAG: hypothetical protein LW809_06640 [Vampirovibrionales bacterium]|nr:hypothetical protein [Vampirovibrionales bacterium]
MSNSERKTFVLKCDKPRYDGGIEIDLERYFGRRLQPNLTSLKGMAQEHLNEDQLKKLGDDAVLSPRQVIAQAKAAQSKRKSLLSEDTVYDMDEALERDMASEDLSEFLPYKRVDKVALKKAEQNVKDALKHRPVKHAMGRQERLKDVFMQGPLQMGIGLTGLLTSLLALCAMNLCARPEGIRHQARQLFQDCTHVFWKGLWNTVLLPASTMKAVML